jgi:radical SAM superfamily enzyme YgiQ (UPF0313 family)
MDERSPILVVRRAGPGTRVLLVHAPYPGRLKFDGQPTSLLCAAGPLVRQFASEGRLEEVGYLDPRGAREEFYRELANLGAMGNIRVACISTSTAAIEEAARIAMVLRISSPKTLIIAGGPHEDDCPEPIALNVPEVDLSIGGDAEDILAVVARAYLSTEATRDAFLRVLPWLQGSPPLRGGSRISSRLWGTRTVSTTERVAVEDLLCRPWTDRPVRFDIFGGKETLPLMISRGCAYGRCTFCAEAGAEGQRTARSFSELEPVLQAFPDAALYFQDSIFPASHAVKASLLPLLRNAGRPWGCQVFLPSLSHSFATLLGEHGCTYVYTGLESGSEELRACVGKKGLRDTLIYERLGWLADAGLDLGISLMFGVMDEHGCVRETEETVEETLEFASQLLAKHLPIAGFYPNVLTVLPGTPLDRGLRAAGHQLDFYKMPRVAEFAALEDGGVGYNFASIPGRERGNERLVHVVSEAASLLEARLFYRREEPGAATGSEGGVGRPIPS